MTHANTSGGDLRAAFVQQEYTPEPGGPFGRLGINRHLTTGIHTPLVLRLALFDQAGPPVGILTMDQNRARRQVVVALRAALARGCGGEPERFLIHATHAHNAPGLVPWRPDDDGYRLLDHLCSLAEQLAAKARAALRPARLRAVTAAAPGWAACRRSLYRDESGLPQVGTHGPRDGEHFLGVESPDEDTLRVAQFETPTGRALGGLVNFACHPTTMYAEPRLSADYPGWLARHLEGATGGTFLALTGAAGDQAPAGSDNRTAEERCAAMGDGLGRIAAAALAAAPRAETGALQHARTEILLTHREIESRQIELAQAHVEALARGERPGSIVRALYGYAFHFHHNSPSVDDWLARDLLGMWEQARRTEARRMQESAEVQVIDLGALAVVGLPCELFNSLGNRLSAASSRPCTMVVEQANGHLGYIPAEKHFAHGGYECCFAQQSRQEVTAGARLVATATDLLASLPKHPGSKRE